MINLGKNTYSPEDEDLKQISLSMPLNRFPVFRAIIYITNKINILDNLIPLKYVFHHEYMIFLEQSYTNM